MRDTIRYRANSDTILVDMEFNGLTFREVRNLTEDGPELRGKSILEQMDALGIPMSDDLREAIQSDDVPGIMLEFHAIDQVRRTMKRYQCEECGAKFITSEDVRLCDKCQLENIVKTDFVAGEGFSDIKLARKNQMDIPLL